jgi:type IV secretion system protein VirD4
MIFICISIVLIIGLAVGKANTRTHDYSATFGNDSKYLSYFNKGFAIGPRAFSQKLSHTHMFVAGPSGSGKSQLVAIPGILSLARGKSSIIINDVSNELWSITSQYLANKGYKVLRLNFSEAMFSESFNPVLQCQNLSDIQKVAMMIVRNSLGESKSDPFWEQSAIMLISLFIRYQVFYTSAEYRTLQNTLLLIEKFSVDGNSVDRLFAATRDEDLLSSYKAFLVTGEKTLASIIATARTALHIFSDPEVAKTTATNSIDFNELRRNPIAIFICNPLKDLEYLKPITALFFQSLFNFVLSKLPDKKIEKTDIFFIIDEFASYTFPNISVTISNLRKYAGMCIIMQDDSALVARYGQHEANQIKTNCGIQCHLKGSPLRVCKELSQTLGKYTYVDEKGVKKTRELMMPDEIRMTEAAIVLVNNQPPLKFVPTPYYKSFWLKQITKPAAYQLKENSNEAPAKIFFKSTQIRNS